MQQTTRKQKTDLAQDVTGSEGATRPNTKRRSSDSETKQQLREKNANRIMTRKQLSKLNEKGNQPVLTKMKPNLRAPGLKDTELKAPTKRTQNSPNFAATELKTPELKTPEIMTPEIMTPEIATDEITTAELKAPELNEISEDAVASSKKSAPTTPIHEPTMITHDGNVLYSQNPPSPSGYVKEDDEANQECFNAYDYISPFALDVFDNAFCLDAYDTSALNAKFQEEHFYDSSFPMSNSQDFLSAENVMNDQVDYGGDTIDVANNLLKNIYSIEEQEIPFDDLSFLFGSQSAPATQSSQQ
ncbi:unnamed protein product [Absidia cylindrospora]